LQDETAAVWRKLAIQTDHAVDQSVAVHIPMRIVALIGASKAYFN